MSTRDHSNDDVQEGYLQQPENNGVGGPSGTSRDKSAEEPSQPPSSTGSDDDDAQLNSDLVTIWTQRLQVLTVVTSFLASMDGQLFTLSALNTQIGLPVGTSSRQIVYSCLASALIFHICAAMLAYVASFALVRYRVAEAVTDDEAKSHPRRVIAEPFHPLQWLVNAIQPVEGLRFFPVFRSPRFNPPPPLSLLTRCFFTTIVLSALGFIAAIIGILAYVWVGLPVAVGITSTVCVGVGVSAAVWAIAL